MFTVNQILIDYVADLGEKLKEQLKKDGHTATGSTAKSIHVVTTPTAVILKSNEATKYLTEGATPTRNKGQRSLYSIILDWVKAKRVTPTELTDEQFAKAITYKRHKQGYKVPNQYNDGQSVKKVIDFERIDKEIAQLIGSHVAKEITSKIKL